MIEETGNAAALCITAAILASLLKQYCKEQAMLCVLGACTALGLGAVAALTPVAEKLQQLFSATGLPESYLTLLWKALGICYLTSVAGDLCTDAGETALARTVELWGRIALVLLSLPLVETLLDTVTEVLG